jgi:ketosteroid isomerase-like protein
MTPGLTTTREELMNRREFVGGAGAMLGAVLPPPATSTVADAEAVKRAIADNYALYRGTDFEKYRATLASDYVLLEHGELQGIADDEKNMTTRPPGFRRTDAFDFKSVTIEGTLAYAVYFLASEIADEKRQTQRRWLESAILRRSGDRWLLALLHSTRIEKPE